jgi:hypothetical protein
VHTRAEREVDDDDPPWRARQHANPCHEQREHAEQETLALEFG